MEGWLDKKGQAELTTFGRRTWKRRWCHLDAETSVFSYYDGYDEEKSTPKGKRHAVHIANYVIKRMEHHERKFVFVLKDMSQDGKPIFLNAESKASQDAWITNLRKASQVDTASLANDRRSTLEVLGLDPDDTPSVDAVNRAWKKVAYKHHPDRGGDINQFLRIKAACENLVAQLQEDEMYEKVTYNAQIERGPPAIGFGMKVVQVAGSMQIEVDDVMPEMRLRSIGPASGGEILRHDLLIGIEDDDVTDWTFDRIADRLSDQRIPVGATTTMYFQRKLRREGAPDEYFEEEGDKEQAEEEADVDPASVFRSKTKKDRRPPQRSEANNSNDTPDEADEDKSKEEVRVGAVNTPEAARLAQENAILRAEIMAFKKMSQIESEDKLEVLEGEAGSLQAQARALETQIKDTETRIAQATEEEQRQQGRLNDTLVQQYGRVVIEMSQRVLRSRVLPSRDDERSMFAATSRGPLGTMQVPPELETYLSSVGLGLNDLPSGQAGRSQAKREQEEKNLCRRTAVLAGAFLDPTLGHTRGRAALSTLKTRMAAAEIDVSLMQNKWMVKRMNLNNIFDRLDERLKIELENQESNQASLAAMAGRSSPTPGKPASHLLQRASTSGKDSSNIVDVNALLDRKLRLGKK